jgi:Carboxypeptidase regulatory-like domain/Calx-beta domain/SdrD B-like domain/WD40-like Beta Propeller Repeat
MRSTCASDLNTGKMSPALTLTLAALLVCLALPFYFTSEAASALQQPESDPQLQAVAVANGKIAYSSYRFDGNAEIYVMEPDGSNRTRLTFNGWNDFTPTWSANGAQIAFIRYQNPTIAQIFVMNADGTNQKALTNGAASDINPAWSPDGTKIAFYRSTGPQMGLYLMNSDGTNQTRISTEGDYPAWSPDGTKLLSACNLDGNLAVYVSNSDGTNRKILTDRSIPAPALGGGIPNEKAAVWSPDGTRIAFNSFREGRDEVYVMNADGSNQVRITDRPSTSARDPIWSPDGTKIAFWDNGTIYVVNPDGTGIQSIANSSQSDATPSWAPLTYTIAGRITYPTGTTTVARGIANVQVKLTKDGNPDATTVTDTNGNYQFQFLSPTATYTVSSAQPDSQVFEPASRTLTNLTGVDRADFVGRKPNTYVITGRVTNVTMFTHMELSGVSNFLSTDQQGNYVFVDVPAGGNYVVKPVNNNEPVEFTPPSQTIDNLSADQVANFTQTRKSYSISGQVLNAAGSPIQGVTMTLNLGISGTTQTDAEGRYSFPNLAPGGTFRLSPSSPFYGFTPTSYDFLNISKNETANFTTYPLYTISGRVADLGGVGVPDVSVSLSGTQSRFVSTDINGNFSIGGLPEGGNYTLVLTKPDYSIGPPNMSFTNLNGDRATTFTAIRLFRIRGRVVDNKGNALGGVTMTLTGSPSGTRLAVTDGSGNYNFSSLSEGLSYTLTPSRANHTFSPSSQRFDNLSAEQTSDFVGQAMAVQFSAPNYSFGEGESKALITVTRTGDTSGSASVKYATSDTTDANFRCDPSSAGQATGIASRKCDYHMATGRLRFAAGETTKQVSISLVNDAYVEGNEAFTISLSNPVGMILGQSNNVPVTITDDDQAGAANPINDTSFFVRQLYVDLLSREPDPAGWQGWTTRIDQCGQPGQPPPPCDRVTVGGDGFLRSGEFFDRQFFVLRLYRTGLGRILRYDEIADLAYVSGFLSDADLELNKQELVVEIMARPEFAARYNSLSNDLFVDTLLQTAAVAVPQPVRDAWVSSLNNSSRTRAMILREISERPEVSNKYLHEAQVVSAYYGFFTRNPDGAYLNYLQRLDAGEINLGDLANAFINAQEYRQRFGQ